MKREEVILVNEGDEVVGSMEKQEVHRKGILHRAVSVIVINSSGEWLLQRRAHEKYHSGGLWSNTCCTHPRPGEDVKGAALRRLNEEVGLVCENLNFEFSFIYKIDLNYGLTEHELDHVFSVVSDQIPVLNTEEVCDFRYVGIKEIESELREVPQIYTQWFRLIFEKMKLERR